MKTAHARTGTSALALALVLALAPAAVSAQASPPSAASAELIAAAARGEAAALDALAAKFFQGSPPPGVSAIAEANWRLAFDPIDLRLLVPDVETRRTIAQAAWRRAASLEHPALLIGQAAREPRAPDSRRWLQHFAQRGHTRAMLAMATFHSPTTAQRLEWVQRAHDLGPLDFPLEPDRASIVEELARAYNAAGGGRDEVETWKLNLEAKDRRRHEALYRLADAYFDGRPGVQPDIRRVDHYVTLLKAEDPTGPGVRAFAHRLGEAYAEGRVLPRSLHRALSWYELGAASGSREAAYRAGLLLSSGFGGRQSKDQALRYFLKAAEQGQRQAIYIVASHYFAGDGVPKDVAKARALLTAYPEQAPPNARYLLAHMAHHGLGGAYDSETALEHYAKAGEQGHAKAQAALGLLHITGWDVIPQDYAAAERWLRLAAAQGNLDAKFGLAVVLNRARRPGALELMKEAADAGHAQARSWYPQWKAQAPKERTWLERLGQGLKLLGEVAVAVEQQRQAEIAQQYARMNAALLANGGGFSASSGGVGTGGAGSSYGESAGSSRFAPSGANADSSGPGAAGGDRTPHASSPLSHDSGAPPASGLTGPGPSAGSAADEARPGPAAGGGVGVSDQGAGSSGSGLVISDPKPPDPGREAARRAAEEAARAAIRARDEALYQAALQRRREEDAAMAERERAARESAARCLASKVPGEPGGCVSPQ